MAEPHPARQATVEATALGQFANCLLRPRIEEPEVRSLRDELDVRSGADRAVGEPSEEPAETAQLGRIDFARMNDVVTLPPGLEERRDDVGRMLQIRIQSDDDVSHCIVEPGGQRALVTEVPRERDVRDPVVALIELLEHLQSGIAAPIVDEDDRPVDAERVHDLADLCKGESEDFLLVVRRDDEDHLRAARTRFERDRQADRPARL